MKTLTYVSFVLVVIALIVGVREAIIMQDFRKKMLGGNPNAKGNGSDNGEDYDTIEDFWAGESSSAR